MKVLSIDPGPHVGASVWQDDAIVDAGYEHAHYVEAFNSWEWTPGDFQTDIHRWVRWADVVVIEGFTILGSRDASSNVTIEMIGVVKYLATLEGTSVFVQRPADSKSFDPKWAKLKRLGWYRPGPDHPNSATRHMILYLAKNLPGFARRLLES